ncbi:SDR family oxidoreductase [Nonomuraea sp. GTA35]|uniref:SDR family oxidoreductase n=1 Tax=Nonomuraea sp. GTA35 TaxID=1676746 RepID=UPI0035BF027C
MTEPVHRRFEGKTALVTGAAGGIGRATAPAFAREGAAVVAADVTAGQNEQTAQLIREQDGRALAVTCDVTSDQDVRAALDALIGEFGHLEASAVLWLCSEPAAFTIGHAPVMDGGQTT